MIILLWLAIMAFTLAAIVLNVRALRRKLISDRVLRAFRKLMPPVSQTEREAIEAGTVWWDGELFCGSPRWHKLLEMPAPALTAEEQRFLDNETEALCALVSEWQTTHIH